MREDIARIIDPDGWDKVFEAAWGDDTTALLQKTAREKADSIIALQCEKLERLKVPPPKLTNEGVNKEKRREAVNAAIAAALRECDRKAREEVSAAVCKAIDFAVNSARATIPQKDTPDE